MLPLLTQQLYEPFEEQIEKHPRMSHDGQTCPYSWRAKSQGFTWHWEHALNVRDAQDTLVLHMPVGLHFFMNPPLKTTQPQKILQGYWGQDAQARMAFFKEKLMRHCLQRGVEGGRLSFSRWKDTLHDIDGLLRPMRFKGLEGFLGQALCQELVRTPYHRWHGQTVITIDLPTAQHARLECLATSKPKRFATFERTAP